ncbi:hypothetical protein JCM14469_01960 [Desulfatiferula olefinivorans]
MTMTTPAAAYRDAFDFDACTGCGKCLAGCAFKTLTPKEAGQAMAGLKRGDVSLCDAMLDQCTFCGVCDQRCPVGARPAALMLERLKDRRARESSMAPSLAYVFNGLAPKGFRHNLFRDIYSGFGAGEKAILVDWSEPTNDPGRDLLWCGCGVRMFPGDIARSRVFESLPKFGGEHDCCGLFAARCGLYDEARSIVDQLIDRLSSGRFNRLVVMCGSCLEMFRVTLPEYFGRTFPFETVSVYEYLEDRLREGTLSIRRRVPRGEDDVCLTDACHGHALGDDYLDRVRRLADAVGYRVTELEHNRDNHACCGLTGYFRHGRLTDLYDAGRVKARDIRQSGKTHILSYCQGCFMGTHLLQKGTAHYLLETLMWALGDDIRTPQKTIVRRSLTARGTLNMIRVAPSALTGFLGR